MLSVGGAYGIILGCCAIGILYGILNFIRVRKVDLRAYESHDHASHDHASHTPHDDDEKHERHELDKTKIDTMLQIGEYISNV